MIGLLVELIREDGGNGLHKEIIMASKGDTFESGARVPASGIYYVIHDKLDGDDHAQTHSVIARSGGSFPVCRGCGRLVTFRLHQQEEFIDDNEHFTDATRDA